MAADESGVNAQKGIGAPGSSGAACVVSAALYMCISSLLSILNRYLLHTRDPPLEFPSLLIVAQACVVGSLTFVGLQNCWYEESSESAYRPSRLDRNGVARVSTVGLLFAGDILLTQCALSLAPVALVEVMKCLIPAVVLVQQSGLNRTLPDFLQVLMVCAICAGVVLAIGSDGVSYNLESGGLPLAAAAVFVAGTRLVATQLLLQGNTECPMPLLLMYITPAMGFTGLLSFLVFELENFRARPPALQTPHIAGSVGLVLLSSLLAFGLNYTELWCIRVTNALVLTVTGAVKTVLLVWVSTLGAGRLLSPRAMLGSALAVGGVALMKARRFQPPEDNSVTPVELRARIQRDEAISESWRPVVQNPV